MYVRRLLLCLAANVQNEEKKLSIEGPWNNTEQFIKQCTKRWRKRPKWRFFGLTHYHHLRLFPLILPPSTPVSWWTFKNESSVTMCGPELYNDTMPRGGFLKIIPIGIPTYAGMETGFYGWRRRGNQFLGLTLVWKPVSMPA